MEQIKKHGAHDRPTAASYTATSTPLEREDVMERLSDAISMIEWIRMKPAADPVAKELRQVREGLENLRADIDDENETAASEPV